MVDVGSLAGKGFRIDGAPGDHAGSAVAPAGDVNGDGRGDLLIGASGTASAYVVFGQTSPGNVALGFPRRRRLPHLRDGDWRCRGRYRRHDRGRPRRPSARCAGVRRRLPRLRQRVGRAGRLDRARRPRRQVRRATPDDRTGFSVAGVGDVNGDGRPDFAVGAPGADPGGRVDAGSAFVVTGVTTPPPPPPPPPAPPPPPPPAATASRTEAEAEAQAEAEEVQEGLPPRARQVQEEAEVAVRSNSVTAVLLCR